MQLEIDLRSQLLRVHADGRLVREYPVSTARNGAGEINGSGCTPRGLHRVRARIGAGCAPGTVFRARRPTGEIWSPALSEKYPGRDWILSRILWLSGTERGRNRLGCVDTFRRYIYIHGTPDNVALEQPSSHGCVRMRNADVIELFDHVPTGTLVNLHE